MLREIEKKNRETTARKEDPGNAPPMRSLPLCFFADDERPLPFLKKKQGGHG